MNCGLTAVDSRSSPIHSHKRYDAMARKKKWRGAGVQELVQLTLPPLAYAACVMAHPLIHLHAVPCPSCHQVGQANPLIAAAFLRPSLTHPALDAGPVAAAALLLLLNLHLLLRCVLHAQLRAPPRLPRLRNHPPHSPPAVLYWPYYSLPPPYCLCCLRTLLVHPPHRLLRQTQTQIERRDKGW